MYICDANHYSLTTLAHADSSRSVTLSVQSGSSLLETCGICGTQSGQLLSLDGSVATNPAQQQAFVESYRAPASAVTLRPIRPVCSE